MISSSLRDRKSASELRIGYLSTVYHSSLPIKGLHLLEDKGINVSWFLFGTGPAIVDAIAQGKLDMGYIGLAPVAIGIGRGVKIKCIAGGHVEGTVIAARKNYRTVEEFSGDMGKVLAQLKGAKVGVPRRGSLHDIFLRHYLAEYHLENDVSIVNYDWADFIPEAMKNDEVQAATGTPPLAVLLSQVVGARVIIQPKMIWPNNPSYGIVAKDSMLKDSKEVLGVFLKIHKDICCRMQRSEQKKLAEAVSKTVGLVDENFVLETFNVSPKYCAALPEKYVESTLKLTAVLRNLGYLSKDLKKEDIFDSTLIETIHPEQEHYG